MNSRAKPALRADEAHLRGLLGREVFGAFLTSTRIRWGRLALSVAILPVAQMSSHAQVPRPPAEARLPALSGTTGMLRTPSAYLQRGESLTVYVADEKTASAGVLIGILNRVEIGFAGSAEKIGKHQEFASAKLSLLPETLVTPAVSAGFLRGPGASISSDTGYAVVSKDLIPYFVQAVTGKTHIALKASVGYGNGIYRNRPFGGLELWGPGGIGLVGEISADQTNIGARFYRNGLGATIGLMESKHVGGAVSYSLALH